MGITYPNTWQDLSYIYTDDGGAFSANNAGNTAFDYFPDDAAVDDALYFGKYERWDDLQIYVGTAFTATSVTFVWEYYSIDASGWATLTVTDNTSGFTVLGQNAIEFVPPVDWVRTGINGKYGMWVRCRISAISGVTEGGANSTGKCQCGNNRILITGYSEGTPATPKDIYDADQAAGWGLVSFTRGRETYHGGYQFLASVQVGDPSNAGYFKNMYSFLDFSVLGLRFYLQNAGTIVQFGEKVAANGNFEFGRGGGAVYFAGYSVDGFQSVDSSGPTLRLFGASVYTDGSQYTLYNAKLHLESLDSILMRGTTEPTLAVDIEHSNITALILSESPTTLSNTRITDQLKLRQSGTFVGLTVYEVVFWQNYPNTSTCYMRNCTFTVKTYDITGADRGVTVYYQFSFDLKVIDENFSPMADATVVMKDQYGTQVFSVTTDASGDITSQWVTYEKRVKIINPPEDTDTFYTPHTVTITSADGSLTRTIQYTMDRKREEVEMLSASGGGLLTHPGMAGGMRA